MGVLRLILAICVVVVHTKPLGGMFPLIGGRAAVQIFYMLSGFYMALILNEKYDDSFRGNIVFWKNRALRIYPPYLLVLALTLAFGIVARRAGIATPEAVAYWFKYHATVSPLSVAALFVTNLFIIGQDVLLFLRVDPASGSLLPALNLNDGLPAWHFLLLPQSWSVSLELMFYAVAPFLVRRRMRVMVAVIGISLLVRVWLASQAGLFADPWSYRFFPNELATFLIGAAAYRAYQWLSKYNRFPDPRYGWLSLAGLAGMFVFLPQWLPQRILLLPVYSAAALSLPLLFHASRRSAIDRLLGGLSYPVYLLHSLVIALLALIHVDSPLPCILCSVMAGAVMQRLVDDPIDRFRHRWFRAAAVGTPRQQARAQSV